MYKHNDNFRKFIKYILYLAYVPKEKVEIEFIKISSFNNDGYFYDISQEYFENNSIINTSNLITKKISFWSLNKRIRMEIPSTTNSCEGYHRHLNSKVVRKKINV
ncbi:hypothetical protein DMUE_0164 [Dictyocoela muelleri]|nr:hypothetical protein DMUE_0164 [Dictyocoela muelleri]